MKDLGPVSIRISEEERTEISRIGQELGDGPSIASGIRALLKYHKDNRPSKNQEEELQLLESEIAGLKNSPFGFDKKEILALEKGLDKAKENFKKNKMDSFKERLKLVNTAG